MARWMTDGEREIWNEMQRDAAPGPGCVYSDSRYEIYRGELAVANGAIIGTVVDVVVAWESDWEGCPVGEPEVSVVLADGETETSVGLEEIDDFIWEASDLEA